MVEEFRSRKLDKEYPVLWADALYEKIRDNGRVVSKAVMVIKGVNMDGRQEIMAVEPMENESEQTYSALFRKLQERGMEKVWLCVSDPGRRGKDVRYILCGIYLRMFHRHIKKRLHLG